MRTTTILTKIHINSGIVAQSSSLGKFTLGDESSMANENKSKVVWNDRLCCFGIWRAWRKHPETQQVLWAKNYGKRAWFIPLEELEKSQ